MLPNEQQVAMRESSFFVYRNFFREGLHNEAPPGFKKIELYIMVYQSYGDRCRNKTYTALKEPRFSMRV
jgi:hypothetical protein